MGFILGLDLGQINDYTATAIIQKVPKEDQKKPDLHLGFLSRLPLGTTYPQVVAEVHTIMRHEHYQNRTKLVVDKTGVGIPVIDMLKQAGLNPIPITITGGNQVTGQAWGEGYGVPKRDLVTALNIAFQTKRLKIQKNLNNADTMINEAMNFRYKISESGHDKYFNYREAPNDDMILATALAVWYADNLRPLQIFI